MKSLRNAGIAMILGVILAVTSLIYSIITIFSKYGIKDLANKELIAKLTVEMFPLPVFFLSYALIILISIFMYIGFISLGKRFNNTLLVISSSILLGVTVVHQILMSIFTYKFYYLSYESQSFTIIYGILNILLSIAMIVFYILLGVSTIKLNKIKMSKIVGILYIISGSTLIIFIGFVLLWVTQIFAGIMFLKASKRLE